MPQFFLRIESGYSIWNAEGSVRTIYMPDPVGAVANTSLPLSMEGITCIWIGVGSFQADFSTFSRITDFIPLLISIEANEGDGLGMSTPLTLIFSLFLNSFISSSVEIKLGVAVVSSILLLFSVLISIEVDSWTEITMK